MRRLNSIWLMVALRLVSNHVGASNNFSLLILHTNDMHSRFQETDVHTNECTAQLKAKDECFGGFARLKLIVQEHRETAMKDNISSVFVNAGDTFKGTPLYTQFKWSVVLPMISSIGLDVMCLGNHEFDDGISGLAPYLANISIPVVATNLNVSLEPRLQIPNLKSSHTIRVLGKRVTFIGYLTPETKTLSQTEKVIFYDEVSALTVEAEKQKSAGADIIIALGHSGFEMDKIIAKEVPHISVVIGGHTDTFLYTPRDSPPSTEKPAGEYPFVVTQESGRKVAVVQAFGYTKYLGVLLATFDDDGNYIQGNGNPVLLDSSIPQDPELQARVNDWTRKVDQVVSEVEGNTRVFLSGGDIQCKKRECNLGNLIADSYVDYVANQYNGTEGWTDAPIAFIQGGAIRNSLNSTNSGGNITYGDLIAILPFKVPLFKVNITGSTLKKVLEHSVERYDVNDEKVTHGEFLQLSGLKVVYDFTREPGNRLVSARVRCAMCQTPHYEHLDNSAVYTVIVSRFIKEGGDGYSMFSEALSFVPLGVTDTDVTAQFIHKNGVIYPEIEGRVTFRNANMSGTEVSSTATPLILISQLLLYATVFCTIFK